MKTKAKKFSHKLLALFMAVLMAASCLTCAFSAHAAPVSSEKQYTDDALEYNDLAWNILSDEQAATALLDYADLMLPTVAPTVYNLLANLPSSVTAFMTWDAAQKHLNINAFGIIKYTLTVKLDSVDDVMLTLESVAGLLSKYGSYVGDAGNIQLKSLASSDASKNFWHVTRENYSSTEIVKRALALLQINSADYAGKDVLGQVLRGDFNLGVLKSAVNIYKLLAGPLGFSDESYATNLVYNIVQQLIFNYTKWYTQDEINDFKSDKTQWVYDDQLFDKLSTELLQKISVLVTYNQEYNEKNEDGSLKPIQDTSATRYLEIKAEMNKSGSDYAAAAAKLGYDPNLVYSSEFKDDDGNPLNVLLFAYGHPDANGYATEQTTKLTFKPTDSLFKLGYTALDLAWDTVLKGSIKLLHVNTQGDRNLDNAYYYYFDKKGEWNSSDIASNYTQAKINEWAEANYEAYGDKSADDFIAKAKEQLSFDRAAAETSTGKWSDIDETKLFAKLRYSPLADYGFNMQTGPINLYFAQTGTKNIDDFFKNEYSNYGSMVAGFNDALVAAVNDLFPQRDNIIGNRPEMAKSKTTKADGVESINDATIRKITSTLVGNALKMVQYTADATDANILKAFYDANGSNAVLSEANLESAMVPMLVACIGQVNLGAGKLQDIIHPAEWDGCKDAEAVAYVCLKEYLSYVLPNKDYSSLVNVANDGTISATLEGTILPMARDAVAYVLEGYVPVTYKGKTWKTENEDVNSSATIFDLLNSVILYYGGDYSMKKSTNSGERAMGVAALLGICDENGNSALTNNLWENIDKIANKFLPILGTLQGKEYGKFDSHDLIWNDVVLSILNISDKKDSGFCGVSNFVYKLITIVSAEPIQSKGFVNTVYDLLADLINGLFGKRYSSQPQDFTTIVPKSNGDNKPFDDLLQVKTIAGTGGTDLGAIQKAICNFVEFTGYGADSTKGNAGKYGDSVMRGIFFALSAVNSFVPEAITPIGTQQLKTASASFATPSMKTTAGGDCSDTVSFTNNCTGLNRAYISNGQLVQLSRYYYKLKSATYIDSNNAKTDITSQLTSGLIAPNETIKTPKLSITFNSSAGESNVVEVQFVYDIVLKDGTVVAADNNVSAYKYMTTATGWKEAMYNSNKQFLNDTNKADQTVGPEGARVKSTSTFSNDNTLVANYPEYMVLDSSNLADISTYSVRYRSNRNKILTGSKAVDGIYFYDEDSNYQSNTLDADNVVTKYDKNATYTTVNITSENAIPAWDKTNGNLLKYNMYDYRVETAPGSGEFGEWNRNEVTEATAGNKDKITYYKGYTSDEIEAVKAQTNPEGTSAENIKVIQTRTHVVYTLSEAIAKNIIAGYHVGDGDIYESVYLKNKGGQLNYDNLFNIVSMGNTKVPGFYIESEKKQVPNVSALEVQPFRYDGETDVQGGEYPVDMCIYNGSKSAYAHFTILVGDTSQLSGMNTAYDNLASLVSQYKSSDFTNSTIFEQAKQALLNVLSIKSSAMTVAFAQSINNKTHLTATTKEVTSKFGDLAYVPYTKSAPTVTSKGKEYTIPKDVLANAYVGGEALADGSGKVGGVAGVYYFDAAGTMPIYSPLALSDDNGKVRTTDQAGIKVIKNADGKYYLANSVVYETTWDNAITTNGNPCQMPTKTQATDAQGNLLYNQVQYVYRDADGKKVNSNEDWSCKFPVTDYTIVPNEVKSDGSIVDNRGAVAKAVDRINYVTSIMNDTLKPAADNAFKNISVARTGLNDTNFNILTFSKMTDIARNIEKNFTVDLEYHYDKVVLGADGNPVIDEATGEAKTEDAVKKELGVSPASAASTVQNCIDNGKSYTYVTHSSLSSAAVAEYTRLFNIFASAAVERGYQGAQLEKEIKCASGNIYSTLTATKAVYAEDGKTVTTEASVSKTTGANAPRFGKWDAEGKLVNDGSYSAESWTRYVRALAAAVALAQYGHGDYAHKDPANFVLSDKKGYDASLTNIYTVDTELQAAEIALAPAETTANSTVTVNAVEGATVTINGAAYTAPVSVETGSTITIDVKAAEGYQVVNELTINGTKVAVSAFPYEYKVDGDVTIAPSVKQPSTYTIKFVRADGVDVPSQTVNAGEKPAVPDSNTAQTVKSDNAGHHTVTTYTWPTVEAATADRVYDEVPNPVKSDCHYTETVEQQPTYTEPGLMRYTCDVCGHSYTAEIPVKDCKHADTKVVNATKPTINNAGNTGDTVCNVCGKTIKTGTVIPQLKGEAYRAALKAAKDVDGSKYTADSYAKVTKALADYDEATVGAYTSQEDVDAAEAALKAAVEGLVANPTTETYTYNFIDGTSKPLTVNKGETPENFANTPAKVTDNKNGTHTTTTYTWSKTGEYAFTEVGNDKVDDCKLKYETVTQPTIKVEGSKSATCPDCGYVSTLPIDKLDGTAYNAALKDAQSKNAKDYTEASYAKVTAALKDYAEDVVATYTDPADVAKATKALEDAVAQLDAGVVVTVASTKLGTTTLNDADATNGANARLAVGDKVVLTAKANNETGEFVGWKVGNKIVSDEASFVTYATADITYEPVFAEKADTSFTVVFVDPYGNVIDTQTVTSGANIEIPTAPTLIGYTFTGWSMTEPDIHALTDGATIYAQYTKDNVAKYTVTAPEGATLTVDGVETASPATVAYDAKVSVHKDGVAAWQVDGVTVAYGDTYTFFCGSDMNLVAVDTAVEQKTTVVITGVNEIAGSVQVSFAASRNVAPGETVVKQGFIYGKNLADSELTLENVGNKGADANAGTVKIAYTKNSAADISLRYGLSKKDGKVSAAAFVITKTADGTLNKTISEVKSYTYH